LHQALSLFKRESWRGIFMKIYYNSNLKNLSRKLRSHLTKEEVRLWNRIRRKQLNNLQFYRQKPLGKYIVDFYCPQQKLVIEIDGGQHYENGEIINEDKIRTDYLEKILGLRVLRFTNNDIMRNMETVFDKILEVCN
jgi:very-short-patch-repair endonuclease